MRVPAPRIPGLLWALLFFFYIVPARAQEASFKNITVEDGLPSNIVYSILEDAEGFMWFGTIQGLSRFDGHEFKSYVHDPNNSNSLADNRVYRLAADPSGQIWIGTGRGLSRLDPDSGTFTSFPHDPNDPNSLSHYDIDALFVDSEGRLLVGTMEGLNLFDKEKNTFKRYLTDPDDPKSIPGDRIVGISQDASGRHWIATYGGGLLRFAIETEEFEKVDLPDLKIWKMMLDKSNRIWLGTDLGLKVFDPVGGKLVNPGNSSVRESHVNSHRANVLGESQDGTIWFATNGLGLQNIDEISGQVIVHQHDPKNGQSLPSNNIQSVYRSSDGILWVGSYGGVSQMEYGPKTFKVNTPQLVTQNGLSRGNIRHILWNDNALLLASEAGLYRYNSDDASKFEKWDENTFVNNGLVDDYLWSILPTEGDSYWLANDAGLSLFNINIGLVDHYRHLGKENVSIDNIRAMSAMEDGRILLGSREQGLLIFDPSTRTGEQLPLIEKDGQGLNSKEVRSIASPDRSIFWIATVGGGLSRYDSRRNIFTSIDFGFETDLKSLETIWTVHYSSDDKLWLGTDMGLVSLEIPQPWDAEKILAKHHVNSSLSSTASPLNTITEDKNGQLWLGYMSGQLARFDPENDDYQFLSDSQVSKVGSFTSSDVDPVSGKLFFAGFNGLLAFSPSEIPSAPDDSHLKWTGFTVFKGGEQNGIESSKELQIDDSATIELNHDQNDFSIGFVGLNYGDPGSIYYDYNLSPYDESWRGSGNQRTATYTALPPGDYLFSLSATNKAGEQFGEVLELSIRVKPPWWTSFWAYTIYTLLALAGLLTFDRVQKRRTLEKERNQNQERELLQARKLKEAYENLDNAHKNLSIEKLKTEEQAALLLEMDEAKGRFFANVSHEFRTPLSLIIGPLEDIRHDSTIDLSTSDVSKLDLAVRNARRVLELINEILDLAKLESGDLKLAAIPADISDFLNVVSDAYRPLAERKNIIFDVDLIKLPEPVYFDPNQLERAFSNILSNAFKFTPEGGKIRLSMSLIDKIEQTDLVEVTVRDSGPGIEASQLERVFDRFHQVETGTKIQHAGTGIGLSLAKEIVDIHDAEIIVDSELGFGTSFSVRLKLGRAHLEDAQIDESGRSLVEWRDKYSSVTIDVEEDIDLTRQDDHDGKDDATTILLVEDNLEVRSYLKSHFENEYRIIEAENGRQGLEYATQFLPDLVISDVMMDEMDGLELCSSLKSTSDTDFIPVILLTARAGKEDKIEGLELLADDYLTKPFEARELVTRARNLINGRKKLQKQFSDTTLSLSAKVPDTESVDHRFLTGLNAAIDEHIAYEDFSVVKLASIMGIDRSHLYRKVKELLGKSPQEVIWQLRLERAALMLKSKMGSVSEVAYGCGFKSVAHFSRRFKSEFHKTPTDYLKES